MPGPVAGRGADLHLHRAKGHDRLRVLCGPHHRQGRHPLEGGRAQLRARPGPAQGRDEVDAGVQVLRQLPPADALAVVIVARVRKDDNDEHEEGDGAAAVARERAQQRDRQRGWGSASRPVPDVDPVSDGRLRHSRSEKRLTLSVKNQPTAPVLFRLSTAAQSMAVNLIV